MSIPSDGRARQQARQAIRQPAPTSGLPGYVKNGEDWLLFMYAKAELDSIAGEVLREMKDEIEKAID